MYPFNLEAAKRGEPFEYQSTIEGWRNASFVGVRKNGSIVGEFESIDIPGRWVSFDVSTAGIARSLRMAPRKRTVYVNLWPGPGSSGTGGGRAAYHYTTAEDARKAAGVHCTIAIAVAVPVEIED